MNKLVVDCFIILLITYGAYCGTTTDATTDATDINTTPTGMPYETSTTSDAATDTTMPYDATTTSDAETDTTTSPKLGLRMAPGLDVDAETETSTATAGFENSTDINLEIIKKEVLRTLAPTKEIIKKIEEASTSKSVVPGSENASAQKSVTKGEAAGILVASLIIAVALICVTKILYNRYKMKTYDVARNNIELGNS